MQALSQLAIIWAAVFVAVVAARATRLTPVLFFLFLGFVMVNVGMLPHEAHPFIQVFGELGIIVIMFALGFEESSINFVRSIRKSWGIALFGALAPFATAYLIAAFFLVGPAGFEYVCSCHDCDRRIPDHDFAGERRIAAHYGCNPHHDVGSPG